MATKRNKPEEIVTKLRQIEVLVGQGKARIDAIREIGVVLFIAIGNFLYKLSIIRTLILKDRRRSNMPIKKYIAGLIIVSFFSIGVGIAVAG